MIMRKATTLAGAVLAGLLAVAPASAEEVTGSGTNTYVPVNSEITALSDEASLLRSQSRSILVAEDPKLPFHLAIQDCAGTYLLDANGQIDQGNGYCDSVDADNDVWWLWWQTVGETGTWGVLGGTGKYKGMTGNGTTKILSQSVDGRFALRWEGTWKMK